MKYLLFGISVMILSSCLLDNQAEEELVDEYNWDTTALNNDNELSEPFGHIVTIRQTTGGCDSDTFFNEVLTLPLDINEDFFTMFDNIGDKISIPYECVNGGELDLHNGEPLNIYYPYGKFKLGNGKDYYLVIETVNPENPVDLFYTSALIFTNNNGFLEDGVELGKYHAYSGVREYHNAQMDNDGIVKQQIKKIGNDGISESVFEERDTSFNINR